jgi:hypothetical protein
MTDPDHRPVGGAQQEGGPLDPAALQIAARRLAEDALERADEVRLGAVCRRSERGMLSGSS